MIWRAISLLQPWASAWMLGIKQNETRDWPVPKDMAGRVVVHASKAFARPERDLFMRPAIYEAFAAHGITTSDQLPLGAILGYLDINGCWETAKIAPKLSALELELGDYGAGRYAWMTDRDTRNPIAEPIPCKGALKFWRVPDDIAATLQAIAKDFDAFELARKEHRAKAGRP